MTPSGDGTVETLIARFRAELAAHASQDAPLDDSLGVDELMRRLDAELGRAQIEQVGSALPLWKPALPELASRSAYSLQELLQFDDARLVDTAYRVLLQRGPDADGRAYYLHALRQGRLTRIGLLAALRWSPEGVSRGIHVDGLLLPHLLERVQRWPLVGPLFGWLRGLARLHTIGQRMEVLRQLQSREWQALGHAHNDLVVELEFRLDEVRQEAERHAAQVLKFEKRVSALVAAAEQRLDALEAAHSHAALALDALERRTDATEAADSRMASDLRVLEERADSSDAVNLQLASALEGLEKRAQLTDAVSARATVALEELELRAVALGAEQDRLGTLVEQMHAEARGWVEASSHAATLQFDLLGTQQQAAATRISKLEPKVEALEASFRANGDARTNAAQSQRALDSLYLRFEERFRGEQDIIRKRAEAYLPLVRVPGIGEADTPVIDVGSGRGEWLDLLREVGLHAFGIDTNHEFVAKCRARGLAVTEADALVALAALPEASAGAITSMHLVEHLPFEALVEMIDQAHRVLTPGGVLILETPNPENINVGTHWFYLDPTHRNPLPPSMLAWLVAERGFADVEIRRQSEHRSFRGPELLAGDAPGAEQVNEVLAGYRAAPDYAVVAWRR